MCSNPKEQFHAGQLDNKTVAVAAAAFSAAPALAQAGIVEQVGSVITEAGPIVIENVAGGLDHPWGMAFLPDGRLLVTERAGNLRIVGSDHRLSKPVGGTPNVFAQGQGGLLDVALDHSIAGFEVIFREAPWITGPNHFGGRIVFDGEGHLFLTLGERFQFEPAQDLSSHLGSVIRLNLDGSVPQD